MCGIWGSVGVDAGQAHIDIVAHRGPDGQGWRAFPSTSGPVTLGHRRLAIIETSDVGLQPMSDPSGRYWLSFNGEIYNYIELREELAARGEVCTTKTDSEVLLRSYMVWGEACLTRLRGMFAFLIWDARENRLFAARDRFGIKPLYIAEPPGGVAFASEIKQLVDLPGVGRRMNRARVEDFLVSGLSDHTGETMFAGIRQVRAGECVSVDASGSRPTARVSRWYAAEAPEPLRCSEDEAAERFRELLQDAVRIHLRSDVQVGSCLSGGLDSSSIVCLASRMLGQDGPKVRTVSACYAEKSVDETPFIDAVVAQTTAEPIYVYPKADDVFARASDLAWHQDEPFGSTSILAQWRVFEEAKRGNITVMLDGQGADEQLGGYHSSFPYHLASQVRAGRIAAAFGTMRERRRLHGADLSVQAQHLLARLLPVRAARALRSRRRRLTQNDWLASDATRTGEPRMTAHELAAETVGLPAATDLASLCVSQVFASNLQMLLHWEDRNSMAHGIEARVPFLDHPLVEFSLALGSDHKIVGADTKRVLRRAMAGVLPKAVLERRDKLGFATPEEIWFRGPLSGAIRDGLETTLTRFPDLFNAGGARAFAGDMLEGRRPVDFALWRMVSLGLWGERFAVSA